MSARLSVGYSLARQRLETLRVLGYPCLADGVTVSYHGSAGESSEPSDAKFVLTSEVSTINPVYGTDPVSGLPILVGGRRTVSVSVVFTDVAEDPYSISTLLVKGGL
ncbi:MAG: hypothetical protein KIS66_14195 [Fimbriimonadaceae bacterium]|nr:hypothetical protein [Fimbriimonadaceae bacterium]